MTATEQNQFENFQLCQRMDKLMCAAMSKTITESLQRLDRAGRDKKNRIKNSYRKIKNDRLFNVLLKAEAAFRNEDLLFASLMLEEYRMKDCFVSGVSAILEELFDIQDYVHDFILMREDSMSGDPNFDCIDRKYLRVADFHPYQRAENWMMAIAWNQAFNQIDAHPDGSKVICKLAREYEGANQRYSGFKRPAA